MAIGSLRVRAGVALAVGALLVNACSGGSKFVDQTAGSDYRYNGGTKLGTTIPVANRKLAGPVTGELLDGRTQYSLAANKGKVVVLNFWATWCSSCRVESPQLDQVYRRMKAQGVDFVGLDVGDAAQSASRAFVAENHISYPIVWDENSHTALELGKLPLAALPNTVIIDKQGRVAAVYVSPVAQGDLDPVLSALVKQ